MLIHTPTQTIASDLSVTTQTVLPVATMSAITEAIAASKRPNTLQAYQSDLAQFGQWCSSHGWQSLPAQPEMVAAYLVEQRHHPLGHQVHRHRIVRVQGQREDVAGVPRDRVRLRHDLAHLTYRECVQCEIRQFAN